MIKTLSYWSVKDGLAHKASIDAAMDEAKAAGFAGIELAVGLDGPLTPETDEATCRRYRKSADDKGLIVQTLASGMSWAVCPSSDDPGTRRKALDIHAKALQRARWLGCDAMLFVPGAVKIPWDASFKPVSYDLAVRRAREAIDHLLPVAEKHGVSLCVENVWNGLFPSPMEWIELIDSYGSDRLGMYFDVGNFLAYHQHPPHWIALLGPRIKRIHIKDYSAKEGFVDLLKGDVPWADTMAALRAIGYDKTIVAEMMPYDPGMPRRTSEAMDKILAM